MTRPVSSSPRLLVSLLNEKQAGINMATVGVLCERVRVEEKLLVAALAEAGVPSEPVVPGALPLPPAPCPPPFPPAPAAAGGPAATLLIDRCRHRAAGAAFVAACRAQGMAVVDAGVAATGDRLAVATALAAAGVPRPETRLVCTQEAALTAVATFGCPATLLPLAFGSAPIALLDHDVAEAVVEHRGVLGAEIETLALIQQETAATDTATLVLVVDGEAVAVAGAPNRVPNAPAWRLAEQAARALGAGFVGVEIADSANGLVVWDVRPAPDFRAALQLGERTVAGAVSALALRLLAERAVAAAAEGTVDVPETPLADRGPAPATAGSVAANGNGRQARRRTRREEAGGGVVLFA